MRANWTGIAGWSCLLLAVMVGFAWPVGRVNGAVVLGVALAVSGVVLVDRAWRIPSQNAARYAAARVATRQARR